MIFSFNVCGFCSQTITDDSVSIRNYDEVRKMIGYPELARNLGIDGIISFSVQFDVNGNYLTHQNVSVRIPILTPRCMEFLPQLKLSIPVNSLLDNGEKLIKNVSFRFSTSQANSGKPYECYIKGLAKLDEGNFSEAKSHFIQGTKSENYFVLHNYLNLSYCALATGDVRMAKRVFRKLIKNKKAYEAKWENVFALQPNVSFNVFRDAYLLAFEKELLTSVSLPENEVLSEQLKKLKSWFN